MGKGYRKIDLYDRRKIEEGLLRGESCSEIARAIGRSPSSVSREVEANRARMGRKERRGPCKWRAWCDMASLCGPCVRQGARCAGCDVTDCRDFCPKYLMDGECEVLGRWPWTCNGCSKFRYGCRRPNRFKYDASLADAASAERRSSSRSGIDMDPERAETVLAIALDASRRGMSPYEITAAYPSLGVSTATLYRWFHEGYGGLTLLDLERQVGFRPRNRAKAARSTPHGPERSHGAFMELGDDERACATELDSVLGLKEDSAALLSAYPRYLHLQLFLKYGPKGDSAACNAKIAELRDVCGRELAHAMFPIGLADNGSEFADADYIATRLFGEGAARDGGVLLYYCDPASPGQKGGCEKNHSELRQALPKGRVSIDDLDADDLALIMSHVNSNPRKALGGLSPIAMARRMFGDGIEQLLDAYGIREINAEELYLKEDLVNVGRRRRGVPEIKILAKAR